MEAFVAVATAQGDESQLSSGTTLESSSFGTSCRSTGGLNPGRQGFSHLLPHHVSDLSRRELLDNGHYWKYLVGEMVPQEPTMAANDGVTKTPSPSNTSAGVAGGEDTLASAATRSTSTNLTESSSKELPGGGGGGIDGVVLGLQAIADERQSPSDEISSLRSVVNTPNNNTNSSKRIRSSPIAADSQSVGGSDVERFDGKIVYNPDGSAYIIEDSELSEDDGSLDVPHLEGCIVDGRGVSLSQIPAIPHIANAFYVSRNPALYNALYGQAYSSLLQDKKIVPELPIMHSYRVSSFRFRDNTIRDKSGDTNAVDEDQEDEEDSENNSKRANDGSIIGGGGRTNGNSDVSMDNNKHLSSECSSVPIKPILMCFICKLSFGYTKSFIAHAMGDHNLILIDQEKDALNLKNVSAIIQPVGKNKDPTISFLEPVSNRVGGHNNTTTTVVNQPCSNLQSVPMNRALHQTSSSTTTTKNDLPLRTTSQSLFRANSSNHSDDNANNIKSSPINSPDHILSSPRQLLPCDILSQTTPSRMSNPGMDLTRKSPASGRSSASPGANISPAPTSSTPNPLNNLSPSGSQMSLGNSTGPPNFITGTTIGVCPEHINGRPSGVDCLKCEAILNSKAFQGTRNLHTRNSAKTLQCSRCNWCYKYQETLEIHMKEKHPDTETSCIYCLAGQPHPRLARGENYTCGYKPYRCEVCNYSTTTKGNLSIHMQSDKHLNNMQELQNGGVPPPESLVQQTAPQHPHSHKSISGMSPSPSGNSAPPPNPKPKPTFRCDVCNYETNVARNLRIHMTSEKHTHNMMVLQQNVKHMQHLSALQQAQNPFDPASLLQFHPSLQMGGGGDKSSPHTEQAQLADMAYNQALLIQMMTGGQIPPHIPPELAPHMDLGLSPESMEPPPDAPDPNPSHLFQCCVCTIFVTDSLEALSHHLTQDRTKLREQEILVLVAGNYMCKLCSYKTNLKANFQLHCKTDKHLQRLQHVNHVKEGGVRNEWKLKYLSMSNPVQVRCNACDYYTNSAHKLQLHAAHQRHEISVLIFRHIHSHEASINEDARIYACALCGFTTRVKLQLLQHTRSLKHLQLEQYHCMQRRAEGKDGQPDLAQVFRVLEQPDSDSSGLNNHSSTSAEVSPSFYNNEDMKDMKRDSNSVLKNALEKESSELNDLTCPFCTFTSESETRLQAHMLTQHSNSELSGASSSSRERERLRDKDHNSSSSAVHRTSSSPESKSNNNELMSEGMICPLCQDICTDKTTLEAHVMQVHSVNSEGLQRLLLLVNQSHWLNNSGRSSGNNVSSSSDMRSDSNDDDKDKSESESAIEDASDSDEFRCQTCAKCFRTLDELCCHQNELGHLEIKQTPGGPGYLCWKKGCNQYFPTAPSLQMHFREIHARGKQTMAVSEKHVYKYRCNECSLAFKTSEKLQLHSQYHAIRDASKCCLCGRSFRSLAALQKHVETNHTELSEEEVLQFKQSLANNPLLLAGLSGQILDPVTTELLRKESAREEEMMEEDNRDDSMMMMCDKDDGGMIESGDNDSNDSIGTKEQQQLEDYLNSQAMAEDSYNDPNRKYKCHRCKVAFTRQNYLTSHNKTLLHRKGEKLSYPMEKYLDPNRPYKCEVCKESFTQKNILLVHYNSVSHLHKLKRAMQEQQNLLGSIPTSLTASLPPSATNLVTSCASKSSTSSSTPPTTMNVSSSPSIMSDDDDKKPYKCNICKVAYSQGSTLDIHMRSVLHQTRASKLQELALTGQIDLTKPLIEQPEPQKLQDQHKKIMQEMLSPKGGDSTPLSFSTPIRCSSPVSNRSQTPNTSPPNTSVSPITSSSPQALSCSRCNFACNSQDQLLQHQHLYCMFSNSLSLFPPLPSPNSSSTPNTSALLAESQSTPNIHNIEIPSPSTSPIPPSTTTTTEEPYQRFSMPNKKSSQMFKHLLESYGFEVVMQFNEYHQKRVKRDDEEELQEEEQLSNEFPELAKSTCPYCKKIFSSVWILKSHCEEIHKNVISMEILENFAEAFRGEYQSKLDAAEAAMEIGEPEDQQPSKEPVATSCNNNNTTGSSSSGIGGSKNAIIPMETQTTTNPTAPSTPTASTTPASSADSVGNNSSSAAGHSSNIPMSLAQHMNDVQQALNAMAASQLQHFNPMLNPMMMAAGLGMALPLGLNMNALAAMNLQPPLVPMMMPPQYEHMNQMNQMNNQNQSQQNMFQQRMDQTAIAKQQQQLLQQQQQTASQQKRARTRITDDQLKILRAHFDINNSPSEDQIQQMAQQSGLPPKVIKHWFRNTLFKERQRNKDSPYNFSNPPSTTLNLEEYEKTGEAKVMPLTNEEQKQYDIPVPINNNNKKESHKKSQQNQNAHHSLNQQQLAHHSMQHEPIDMKFLNHDSQSELSETESDRHEDDMKPLKMSRSSKGGGGQRRSGSPFSGLSSSALNAVSHSHNKNSLVSSIPETSTSSSPSSLTLTSLITSQLNPLGGEDSNSSRNSQNMLPPPKMNNFATPSQVPNSSLLSLASPVSLNSPGSGRSDTPLTTPPLPNSANPSSSSGKRANRTRFTDYQIKVLQEFFENNAYPKDDDLEYLSKLLSLSPRVIVVWFQNARQKARKVYENQPPVDSSGDESAGRFQRTPGLNYQCKKCLLVFQRYYELIRHQKTHCFKEEDAKRSAQAQAAAAQVAAAMSSEDSNSSIITDNNSMTSSCGPSPAPGSTLQSGSIRESSNANQSQSINASSLFNSELKKLENQSDSFQCEKCSLVFERFDLWREHQLVHIMNPNLFPSFSPESPFGILQQHAHSQQQQQQQQQQQSQSQQQQRDKEREQRERDRDRELKDPFNESNSATSSVAGDATAKRKWSADEQTDDDNTDQPSRDKRLRTTILPEQLDYLYQKYQIESNPSRKMLETIAREVGLKKRVVQVWFQNTRARERKGQFRAHAQVINKRCPFCPALFKVKSALETHLTAKHADQYTKGDINIDALPDEEIDSASSPLGDTKVPNFGANSTNSLGAAPTSPPSNIMPQFLQSLSSHAELESSLKILYEQSLKRYAQEVQAANQNGRSGTPTPTDMRFIKSELPSPGATENPTPTGEFPLDLSKPVDLSRALAKPEAMDTSFLDAQDYLSDGDELQLDTSHDHDSNPNSPASSTTSQKLSGPGANSGNKRFRTQLAAFQVKVMKSLFEPYKTPTMAECEMLGREIGLAKRVIQVWYQNQRAKLKKKQLQNLIDTEPEPPKLPEECKYCNFKYSHKYSVQDHIFTKKHIDMVKVHIESGKLFSGEVRNQNKSSSTTTTTTTTKQPSSSGMDSSSLFSTQMNFSSDPELANIPHQNFLNGQQQATLLQQIQLLQMANSNVGASGSFSSSPSLVTSKDSFSAINTTTTNTNCGSSNNSGLSAEEINLLQFYGLGTSTATTAPMSHLNRPALSASSGASTTGLSGKERWFAEADDDDDDVGGMTPSHKKSLNVPIITANNIKTTQNNLDEKDNKFNSLKNFTLQTTTPTVQSSTANIMMASHLNASAASTAISSPVSNKILSPAEELAQITGFDSEEMNIPRDLELLRSLNLTPKIMGPRFPRDDMNTPTPGNQGTNPTALNTPPPTAISSSGLNSEMEYVVQKIAALAGAANTFDSTDSNANIQFENTNGTE